MSKSLLIAALVLGTGIFPLITSAQSDNDPIQLSKDTWLKSFMPILPDIICKSYFQDPEIKKRFDELKMTYNQCVTLVPRSTKKCQNLLYKSIPDSIDTNSGGIWGKKMGGCIGKDFAETYIIPK